MLTITRDMTNDKEIGLLKKKKKKACQQNQNKNTHFILWYKPPGPANVQKNKAHRVH